MSTVKERRVFSLKDFRGLDKENKALKVKPFRASDGHNFIIESNSLKTRPAFKMKGLLPFVVEEGDYIIDWHVFNGITVYITARHIFFNHNGVCFNETDENLVKSVFGAFDFTGKAPLFQEEKDCLFIFCLGYILVFTYINIENNEKYVLYDLADKPDNPYDESDVLYNAFENLPKPYEPTIFINQKSFEDINLLSKVTKYRLHTTGKDEKKMNYSLPTHFDVKKHENYDYEIEFYNGKVKEVFPVLLGRENEDFINAIESYGGILNAKAIEIEDEFYPLADWEYSSKNEEKTLISGNLDLKKENFFNFKEKETSLFVFDYLVKYIDDHVADIADWEENKILMFSLPVVYNSVTYDGNTVIEKKKDSTSIDIYVILKKYEFQNFDTVELKHKNKTFTRYGLSSFPDFPEVPDWSSYAEIIGENEILEHYHTEILTDPNSVRREFDSYWTNFFAEEQESFETDENYLVVSYIKCHSLSPAPGGGFQTRYDSMVLSSIFTIKREKVPAKQGCHAFSYEDGAFKLIVKNWFVDLNNEPCISLKVTFNKNPDYELISKTTFGINFGSENRLFLAGNEKYPNIDRYNVSNDLLGDNIISQSYETSYFPSKNQRVLGGKGKINGYVIATDNQMYITKEEYPNDSCLFIRQRVMDDNGVVGYNEHKTSIKRTPLNNRCIVRFSNDILMLTRDGLYAIEISSNVLTNERLERLRSSFINKDMVKSISQMNASQIFILENNNNMYMFIGKKVYVADRRYIDQNEQTQENSYEIVVWNTNNKYRTGKLVNSEISLLDETNSFIYTLKDDEKDDYVSMHYESVNVVEPIEYSGENFFVLNDVLDNLINNDITFTFNVDIYKIVGVKDVDFSVDTVDDYINVINNVAFRNVNNGDKLYYKDVNDDFIEITVENFDERGKINFPEAIEGNVYQNLKNTQLYVTQIFECDGEKYVRLSPYKPETIEEIKIDGAYEFSNLIHDNDDYFFPTDSGMKNVIVNQPKVIDVIWLSAITDFGNNLSEKTMFKTNIYATKKEKHNSISFGYRTMRSQKSINDTINIDLSNPFNFDQIDFNSFSFNTFNEIGLSIPTKENNFLYIQFFVKAEGVIELNSIEILYKLNRLLKTVG